MDNFQHTALVTTSYVPEGLRYLAEMKAGPPHSTTHGLRYCALLKMLAYRFDDAQMQVMAGDYVLLFKDCVVSQTEECLYLYCAENDPHIWQGCNHYHGAIGFFMAARCWEAAYWNNDADMMEQSNERLKNTRGVDPLTMDPVWEQIQCECYGNAIIHHRELDIDRLDAYRLQLKSPMNQRAINDGWWLNRHPRRRRLAVV